MLELTQDVDLDPAVFPLIDGINGTAPLEADSTVTLAGFGTVSNTRLMHSSSLMRVDVGVVSQAACETQNPYARQTGYIDFRRVLCTGGPAGKDSCVGDSGGPAVARDAGGRAWLAGVLSRGSELPSYTDWCAVDGRYGMYTRVRDYADFVYATMQVRRPAAARPPPPPAAPLPLPAAAPPWAAAWGTRQVAYVCH